MSDMLGLSVDIGLILVGLAVWCGWYRGWTQYPTSLRVAWLGVPWISAIMAALLGLLFLHLTLGVSVSKAFYGPPVLLFAVLSLSTSLLQRPRWALPPWYRRQRHSPAKRSAGGGSFGGR